MQEGLLQGLVGVVFLIELVHDLCEEVDGLKGEVLQKPGTSGVSEKVVKNFLVFFSLQRGEVNLHFAQMVDFDFLFPDESGYLLQGPLQLGFVLEVNEREGRLQGGRHFLQDELGDFEGERLVHEVQLEVRS